MSKFSSQEIESQYNLIKTLLSDPEKYKDALDAIKKDIAYMPLELKKIFVRILKSTKKILRKLMNNFNYHNLATMNEADFQAMLSKYLKMFHSIFHYNLPCHLFVPLLDLSWWFQIL